MDIGSLQSNLAYDGSGTDEYDTSGGNWVSYSGGSTWYPLSTTTQKFSIRADFIS